MFFKENFTFVFFLLHNFYVLSYGINIFVLRYKRRLDIPQYVNLQSHLNDTAPSSQKCKKILMNALYSITFRVSDKQKKKFVRNSVL